MKVRWIIVVALGLLAGLAITRSDVGSAQGPSITINVDAAANRRPINPNIYGVAFASTAQLADLNSPLNRSGGNATSQYNWQCNCDNRGSDWYFESLDSGSAIPGKLNDDFIAATRAANAEAMVTIPTIGWVAKLGSNRAKLASFSQTKYSYTAQSNDSQWFPDAGNGVRKSDGSKITGNDPNDANTPVNSTFQQGWMQHLVSTWGTAANGGLHYYLMDNEPSLWQETHRDVHPTGPTMDEIKNDIIDYASRVKATDASAVVVGPEEWGWPGYFYSGADQQVAPSLGWDPSKYPDRQAHGGADYLPWVLDQLHQHDQQTGQRSLDVFTVHWYPQGSQALGLGSEAFNNDTSTAMSNLRNRSTRSLWDPNYTDQSWINSKVFLIPRLRNWVNAYYPGLQIGVTEYNWGAEPSINGATAQADVLGIFGREGVDMATRWTTPDSSTPTYKAIKMYRNYDGAKSTFGDVSVLDSVPDPDTLSSFAAQRLSDGALTVMVINKQLSNNVLAAVNLAHFSAAGTAQVWQLTSGNSITRLNDLSFSGSSLNLSAPAQSITLLVIAPAAPTPTPTPTPAAADPTVWSLAWSDEFDGPLNSPIDSSKWTAEVGGNGWGNQELEYYTNRIDNAYQSNGSLVIKALKETYTGSDNVTRNYTSARLITKNKFTAKYGRVEARLKIPFGQGLWPAFWMLGDNIDAVGWPNCGEMDIMENIGREPSIIHGTLHGPGYSGGNGLTSSYSLTNNQKFADDFHVFAIEWEPGVVRFYCDDILYKTKTTADLPPGTTWVFDHPFFLILNVAVGGTWPGSPDAITVFPQTMSVDYVRVYQRTTPSTVPVILVEEGSGNAMAVDSTTYTSRPFHLTNPNNLSVDQRTRLLLLVANIDLVAGDDSSVVTAQAKDPLGNTISLPVEAVVKVPNFYWLTQVIVQLPDSLANLSQFTVTVTYRGQTSNSAIIQLAQ
jgi:beta-glucanase (GH16 family)